ncbi:hypothetical protein P692DRAFT_20881082 [Suillus brevipes Sb2]|nr:hypothetical protein P692DRAFT_20881082 [Suillus brevipes Sb2]
MSNAGFSLSTHFKLAELLSQDSAQFASRVSSLGRGRVAVAGKALDKLMDNSHREERDESQTFDDIFGLHIAPSLSPTKTNQRNDLLDKVVSLRNRLRSIGINEGVGPSNL